MDNIYIRTDPAGNIKQGKEKFTEKIAGAVATVMALGRAIRCDNGTSESVYDGWGILFIRSVKAECTATPHKTLELLLHRLHLLS